MIATIDDLMDRCEPEPNTGCMLFAGSWDALGRGRVRFRGTTMTASRVAFFLAHDRWPAPNANHKCDTPACCEPKHLFEGTQADNIRDMDRKGRRRTVSPRGERAHHAKLSDADVSMVRGSTEKGVVLAALLGVTPSQICAIRRGRSRLP